ncbi:MAG: HU family DNA-binding protein [Candidatus Alcyoniella australis]|nr:HU family DNA-binding protein [Candidatus Alcyoniella australis]
MATVKKPMTKAQIVTYFAEKHEMPKKNVVAFFEDLVELAAKQTKTVGAFTVPGIGKITKKQRKARMGRNPATGEAMKIPAKTVVKARLTKAFSEAVVPPKKK